MEENSKDLTAEKGKSKGKKIVRYVLICLIIILAAAGYAWYSYNLPARRLERALESADALMEEKNYEEASAAYAQAEGIDGVSPEALEGHIRADLLLADAQAQKASDIPSRAEACVQYEAVIDLCDTASAAVGDAESDRFTPYRTDAEEKRAALHTEIAADYEKVDCLVETQDRSGTVTLPDGSEVPYAHYFDLAKVDDKYYPYADKIDKVLQEQMEAFFADSENNPSSAAGKGSADEKAVYRDYVGVEGIYSGQGLLCIRMAHVKKIGTVQSNDYCGIIFRLSDAEQVSLTELTGKTDIGLRRLIRRAIWNWLQQEGYTEIKKAQVEDYVDDTDPADFKYCIRDDGTLCVIVDQSAPFFKDKQQTLQIPLEAEGEDEE